MSISPDLTLKELQNIADQSDSPYLAGIADRLLASTYEEFIDVLYTDLDRIVSFLESMPHIFTRDRNGEDRISISIVINLKCMGYNASHGTLYGGNTDLLVRKNNYSWVGEAKIHSSYEYIYEGFLQLTTRYSSGTENGDQGGLLIYIYNKDANTTFANWGEYLD